MEGLMLHRNLLIWLSQLLKLLMSEPVDASLNDWGLPFGQMVESEAFNLEHSLSITENLERLASLADHLDTLRTILTDDSRPHAQRVTDALSTFRREPLPTSLSRIEQQKSEKLADLPECEEEVQAEPTIKIDLASQEDLQSEEESEITSTLKNCPKLQQGSISCEDVEELRSLVRVREQEVARLRQEKDEAEGQYRRQVAQLTRRVQASEERLAGCSCKLAKGQEMSKMNKWLQTLNKLLYGAQKQAAISRDQLKRSGEMSAKQLKEKDEQIRQLETELQVQRNAVKRQFQE